MKIVKPAWVCSKDPLVSCDVHPDGTKFVTAGQGDGTGKIMIWFLSPVSKQKVEQSSFKKSIATLEHHQGCVNCVRWSHSGRYLASAGDDKVVMIWATVRYEGSDSESYKCIHILRGHDGDALDLAWSPDDKYLASTSIDNTIIVWNCNNFPDKVTTLRGHSGMVKGVIWDPIGRYLASQSTDKTLRVWRVSDWQEEAKISAPFSKCGGTTTVLRIGWSPDGQYIVSSHAMNNEGPVAKIIEREKWQARMDFVGHRRAIESVRFNPHLFYYNKRPVSCVAIAGRDSSISVWLTALKRPLFILHDVFTSSVLDMSWTPDGYSLIICSHDGSLAYVELNSTEIGKTLSPQQTMSLKNSLYGNLTKEKLTIIENPDLVDANRLGDEEINTCSESEEAMDTSEEAGTETSSRSRDNSPIKTGNKQNGIGESSNRNFSVPFSSANGHSSTERKDLRGPIPDKLSLRFQNPTTLTASPQVSSLASKQVETVTQDGKRRIMPITLKEVQETVQNPPQLATKRVLLTSVSNGLKQPTKVDPRTLQPQNDQSIIKLRDVPVRISNHVQSFGARTSVTSIHKNTTADKLFATIAGCTVEVDNLKHFASFTLGPRTWKCALSDAVTTLSTGKDTFVLGCGNGSLYVFNQSGVLDFPVINVGCGVIKSAVSNEYVAVVTDTPAVSVWNVKLKKNILKDESLKSFMTKDRYIFSLAITNEGNVTIGFSDKTSFCFSYSLSAWMLIGHQQLDSAWYTELESNNKSENQILAPILNTSVSGESVNKNSGQNDEKIYLNTVLMLEQQILVASDLNSLSECRLWLTSLVRYITLQQDKERLRALLQRFMSSTEDIIFGQDKISLMKDLLKIVASNVSCQRVYSDFKQQVEWAENRS